MLTDNYTEDEIQALIILAELFYPVENPNNNHYKPFPKTIAEAQTYFRRFALDLSKTYKRLLNKGLLYQENGEWRLTTEGKKIADEMRLLRPPIYYFYRDFYAAIEHSQAFNTYATRVFGKNLGQHGFSDLKEIHLMMEKLELDKDSKVLDIGCGNGKITEYISDITQASVTGIDYIPEAIMLATQRTADRRYRLNFIVGNLEILDFPPMTFNAVISIDSIFFGRQMKTTLAGLSGLLKPTGQMAIFNGDYLNNDFVTSLKANNLKCATYDISEGHYRHLQLKHKVVSELEKAFDAEGNTFIWKNLMVESLASAEPYDAALSKIRRYLHIVTK
jgi:ubiquinone/menaquinone biosynthesis C-methylase UbiE